MHRHQRRLKTGFGDEVATRHGSGYPWYVPHGDQLAERLQRRRVGDDIRVRLVGVGFGKIVWNVDVDPSKPARLARLAQGVGELVGVDRLCHDSRASAGGDRDDRLLGGHDLERARLVWAMCKARVRRQLPTLPVDIPFI